MGGWRSRESWQCPTILAMVQDFFFSSLAQPAAKGHCVGVFVASRSWWAVVVECLASIEREAGPEGGMNSVAW
jgi:hypothetical protein